MYDSWTITPEVWIFKSENSVRVKFPFNRNFHKSKLNNKLKNFKNAQFLNSNDLLA
jgi:hypothetical protein